MSHCRSCNAPVVWVETEATATKPGRRMPLDANPSHPSRAALFDNGNIKFIGRRTGAGTPIVRVVDVGPNRCRTHFASCPNAARHRIGA